MNPFDVEIPMIDRPLVITVKLRDGQTPPVHDLYYCNELTGCLFCNEHNVWIYEPHQHAALLLNEEQIKHLGKAIGQH